MMWTLPRMAVLCLALVAASGPLSPLATPAASAQALPYQALVAVDQVPVRSGAGRMYYEVGSLDAGVEVTVEDELFGWYKVRVPDGVYSFVERKNVDAKGDGSTGEINTDRTQIYAAHATKGPADSYRSQTDLDRGATVKIVGEVGNVYRIVPPDNVYVFLPPASVTPKADAPAPAAVEGADPLAAEPLTTPRITTEAPEVETPEVEVEAAEMAVEAPEVGVTQPDADPEPRKIVPAVVTVNPPVYLETPEQPQAPSTPVEPAPEVAPEAAPEADRMHPKLAAIEEVMAPYFGLPVAEQPIGKLVQAYATAASLEDLSPSDLQLIQDRLATIERNRELANALGEIKSVQGRIDTPSVALVTEEPATMETETFAAAENPMAEPAVEAGPIPLTATPEAPAEPVVTAVEPTPVKPATSPGNVAYDAVGILTASTVHNGSNQPELLRLVDPTARRTIAYVEPGGPVDTLQMLGQLVGIVGTTQYDPTTRLRLIEVSSVDVLTPAQ